MSVYPAPSHFRVDAGRTPRATIDFETRSAAGFVFDPVTGKWRGLPGASGGKKGLRIVGAAAYAEHPSTDILTLSYTLPGWNRPKRWRPGAQHMPEELFAWIAAGGHVEAHNVMFERLIWFHVARRKYGFPELPPEQLHCSMATAHVNSFPGGLGDLGEVLRLSVRKNKDGRRLLNRYSIPRNPTKTDPRVWIAPTDPGEEVDGEGLFAYCDEDVLTEHAASDAMPPMTPMERNFWLIDQEINWRGLAIDRKGVRDCIAVLNQALARYGEELRALTGGIEPTQLERLKGWLAGQGVHASSLDADGVEALLARPTLPPAARRAIEIRALVGSASVKKLFAMENMASRDDRLRNLMVHHGARTGRPTGEGAQPLNMPRSGPKLATCGACAKPFVPGHSHCPWCAAEAPAKPKGAWKPEMVDHVLEIMAYRSLELVEWFFGDAVLAISGCLRGLFVGGTDPETGEELEFIASDYSAIEAVVTAMLSGEQWRIDAFVANKPIYLMSASKITGTSVEDYEEYNRVNGDHHPDRQNIGKVAELALGFGGWINAWRNFDDSDNFTDQQVKDLIKAWRAASPSIVELWGGQWRGAPWNGYPERYGFEGAAIDAIQYPDQDVRPRLRDWSTGYAGDWKAGPDIVFRYDSAYDALLVTLPSGRQLTYHQPRLEPSDREYSPPGALSISYMTHNSNPNYGPMGWVRMSTFGGRLTENIVQAVAHDLLRFAIIGLRAIGLRTVLHVYDEIIVEVPRKPALPAGVPDPWVAQVEAVMSTVPPWAAGWPVRASGGWRGKRYRKG